MSILYPDPEDTKLSVYIDSNYQFSETVDVTEPCLITFRFSSNCGKFGADESLDEIVVTPGKLLHILQKHPEDHVKDHD